MKLPSRLLLTLAAMVALAPPVLAQSPQPDAKALFDGYVTSEPYRRYLETIFNRGEPQPPKDRCPTMKVVASDQYLVLDAPTFKQAGGSYEINAGAWIAVAKLDRCGKRVTRRALLKAVPGTNGLDVTLLLPGEFRGNLQLEAAAEHIVVPPLMAAAKCQDVSKFAVSDTKLLGRVTPQAWAETWTALACGTVVTVKVDYRVKGKDVDVVPSDVKVR